MENASKAVLMAGGTLLAIMILSLIIYVSTSISGFAEEQDKRTLAKQIEEFNKGYLAYNKTILYGADILTVYNKAQEDKDKYDVSVEAVDESNNIITIENTQDFKISIFKCEKVEYNNETGIVKNMKFKRIEIKSSSRS